MASRKIGKGARFELRAKAAELKGWGRLAKARGLTVAQMVRYEMAEVIERHRRVGVAMGLGTKQRAGGREPRGGLGKRKAGV